MRSSLRRGVLAGAVAALAATAVVPAYANHDNGNGKSQDHKHAQGPKKPKQHDPCTGSPEHPQQMGLVVVDSDTGHREVAPALVALPRKEDLPDGKPRGIVVFDHGYGHTMESWRRHLTRTAATLGVIAIAPEYRGQIRVPSDGTGGLPKSRGWEVANGADDTIAYAREFERLCSPTGINVVYGVSMGGNTSGLVVAAQPKDLQGKPLFDYWVDVEGAVNVTETYLGARALAVSGNATARNAYEDIKRAFGNRELEEAPGVYADHTVVTRTGEIAGAGLKGVVVVHGVVDGLVTHDHSRQLQSLLRAEGVPVDFWSAVTRKEGTEPGTTVDGYLPVPGHTSPFAGHASETSETHVVGLAGFAALDRLYSDEPFTCGEAVYDGTVDSTVRVTNTGC